MNLNQLPYIIAIANQGSLLAAAQQLGISQPALSKYLSGLEQSLHIELFFSEKKKLYPTEAGRIYLAAARKILNLQKETLNTVRNMDIKCEKELHIGITPHQGVQIIAKIYRLFKSYFPKVELILTEGYTKDLYKAVLSGKVDYAITTFSDKIDGCKILPLGEEELLLCVPSFYKLSNRFSSNTEQMAIVDLYEFRDAPFVLMEESTTVGEVSQEMFKKAGFTPLISYSSANGYMVDEMIHSGVGVGIIPFHSAAPADEVVYFRLNQPDFLRSCVLMRQNHDMSQEERYLTSRLLKMQEEDYGTHLYWNDDLYALADEFKDWDDDL